MAQIELKDITKTYIVGENTIRAVEGISLEIEKGEFVSIIGHSGSGKTTLLSIMGGILEPTSGKVFVNGTDIYSLSEEKLAEYRAVEIGYIFQFASLLPVLTAKENLLLPTIFRPKGSPADGDEKRAIEYLTLVGLGDKIDSYPSQLSGGQQRRVAIARALMNRPSVILADEPTGDLDEETEAEVMELFRKINREQNITFILVTHSSDLAKEATRRFKMAQGRIQEISGA